MDHANVTRRSLLLASLSGLLGCAVGPAPKALRLLGQSTLAHRLDFKGTVVGGISGIDYDPVQALWYLLSDDRSELGPARFYTARIPIGPAGLGPIELLDVVILRQADDSPYPARHSARQGPGAGTAALEVPDPESIRWRAQTGTLLWSSEGDARLGLSPFVREIRPDGSHVRELRMPAMFQMQATRPGGIEPDSGPRDNLAFEGLALTPDGQHLWVAMEAALAQDGPLPTTAAPGGPCRLTCFDVASGQALRQIAYLPDALPRPPRPASAHADNGISEILMQDPHQMLVLERAFMAGYPPGRGASLRIYRIDTSPAGPASDTLASPVLRPGQFQPVAKHLVANLDDFTTWAGTAGAHPALERLDNTECMAWGPALSVAAGSQRSLVLASDDNFNAQQITQFLAFAWS